MGFRSVLACIVASLLACASAPALARQVYTYEHSGGDAPIYHYFDMDRMFTALCRRDWKSIGCGAFDQMSLCDYGRFCLKIFGEAVPIIVPRDNELLSAPGMSITTTPFEFPNAPTCLKTRVVLENGDWSENISCGRSGIFSLRMKTAYEDVDLFLRGLDGLDSEGPGGLSPP